MTSGRELPRYCAAFFSGRDDLATFAVNGGPYNEETEGIHNFLGFQEDWTGGEAPAR